MGRKRAAAGKCGGEGGGRWRSGKEVKREEGVEVQPIWVVPAKKEKGQMFEIMGFG